MMCVGFHVVAVALALAVAVDVAAAAVVVVVVLLLLLLQKQQASNSYASSKPQNASSNRFNELPQVGTAFDFGMLQEASEYQTNKQIHRLVPSGVVASL